MINTLIDLSKITLSRGGDDIFIAADLMVNQNECLLINGKSGSGKTSLCEIIIGNLYAHGDIVLNLVNGVKDIAYISQYSIFKDKTGMSDFYYQQRFNSNDADNTITVTEYLLQEFDLNDEKINFLIELFNFKDKLNSSLLYLSSGERKKLQLIRAFAVEKSVMILDNPFIGLDKLTVNKFHLYLNTLIKSGITFIIVANIQEIPAFITHVCIVKDKKICKINKNSYVHNDNSVNIIDLSADKLLQNISTHYDVVVELKNVAISYGEKQVLKNIDWKVLGGSKWLLSGENGAGKSTLLSLINGDHPQAYANDIKLFGYQRGSGESIWEIKQKIGYISPELHWNFDKRMSCLETVLSGFFDTSGLYRQATDEQKAIALAWLENLGLGDHIDKLFAHVSNGIQRYLLLLRAIVKNPPLFIFDEPCQGLDQYQTQTFIELVDRLFADSNHTVIYVSHVLDEIPACIIHKLHLADGIIAYKN